MKGGVNQARQVVDYLNGDRARQVFSTGFPWQVLQHMGLDGASSNMSERVGLARCIRGYIAGVAPGAPPPFLVQHCYPHQLDLLVHATWDAVPYLCKVMDPMATEIYLYISASAVRATGLKQLAEAMDVTGSVKKAAGRWLSRDNSIQRLRTTRPALVEQLEHDMVDPEQKAWAQGIRKVVTNFMFVCTS